MAVKPPGLELNGVPYKLYAPESGYGDFDSWLEHTEPAIVSQPEIAGLSRSGKQARPDKPTWTLDDWSKGEGQEFIDPDDPDSFKKYYYNSTGSVDVISRPGAISLGLLAQVTNLPTNRKYGPYLAYSRGYLSAFVDDHMFTESGGVYTDKGLVAAASGNLISGQIETHGGFIYVTYKDGSGAGNSSKIRRFIWDGTTLTQATFANSSNMEQALVANNRLWVLYDGGGKLVLRGFALTGSLPISPISPDPYTADGSGSEAGLAAIGSRVFMASQYVYEESRIHLYDGSVGLERVVMPLGFRMDTTPYRELVDLGDIIFAGGYREGASGQPELPILGYVAGGRSGVVGVIRENIGNTNARIRAMAPGFQNRLLMGTDNGQVFAYDVAQGGISQLITGMTAGLIVTDIVYAAGRYFIATRGGEAGSAAATSIWDTKATGVGKYPTSAKVHSSLWDFGYPETIKMFTDITINTDPLPGGCTVDLEVVIDGTTYTTDKDGTTMTHSGTGATRSTFTLSGIKASDDSSVSRAGRIVQINMTLKNSVGGGGSSDVTPTVRSVTLHAYAAEDIIYTDVMISLEQDEAYERMLDRQWTGETKLNNLYTIRNAAQKTPYVFKPYWHSAPEGYPRSDVGKIPVLVEVSEIHLTGNASGYARLRLKHL